MQQDCEYVLEQSRNDKIKSLGFLCYNLYVDGVMVFPKMNELVDNIRKNLSDLLVIRQSDSNADYLQMKEDSLNEQLTDLGCICYNLYVDSKLFNSKVLSLCDLISSINREIAYDSKVSPQKSYKTKPTSLIIENKNVTQSKFKINCPYGMELIPLNFKECICGYRNRSEARYCGKCGAKLS